MYVSVWQIFIKDKNYFLIMVLHEMLIAVRGKQRNTGGVEVGTIDDRFDPAVEVFYAGMIGGTTISFGVIKKYKGGEVESYNLYYPRDAPRIVVDKLWIDIQRVGAHSLFVDYNLH